MKNKTIALLSALMVLVLLVGCASGKNEGKADNNKNNKIKIVTTIFPEYDWVRNIVGENIDKVDIKLLVKNGVDLHNYQPNTDDLLAISNADIFIYVGGRSDQWVDEALKDPVNKDRVVINLFDVLDKDLKPLKESEGMEHHHDEEHHHDDEHHHDEEHHDDEHHHDEEHHDDEHHDEEKHHHENDEHVWLSLPRTIKAVDYISTQLVSIDDDNSDVYENNTKDYIKELEELDQAYRACIGEGTKDTVVFADRFPFYYMADDYGLNYYAAFTGCSAESEASFETVSVLAKKIDEYELKYLLTIENRTHKIPETVIESTTLQNQEVLEMNSLQSVTEKDINDGITYLNAMKSNLEVLKIALQ